MKLLAWSGRLEWLGKDIEDIYFILRHYFEISGDALYEQPYDDLLIEEFDPTIAAARMLRRQIAEVLGESEDIYFNVRDALAGLTQDFALYREGGRRPIYRRQK